MLLSWIFGNSDFSQLDSFILVSLSLSIMITLRKFKSKVFDIDCWRMSLHKDNNFDDIFMIMIECARKFYAEKRSFKYGFQFYSYSLRKFREEISHTFMDINEWSTRTDIKTFLQNEISIIINNLNVKLASSLKNNKKRINVIYINPPEYEKDKSIIYNKSLAVRSVKFIGEPELEKRIMEKEKLWGLDSFSISHYGVLKYHSHDSKEIDLCALKADFISFLNYAKKNNLLDIDTTIYLEANESVKHLLVATLNRELKDNRFKNTVLSYYDYNNDQLSDSDLSSVLKQVSTIVNDQLNHDIYKANSLLGY